ncbi:MAG TPA: MFS transporter [bacterium]|nr:MFS transporter [bacterium]
MTFLRRWLRVPIPPKLRASLQIDFLAAVLYGAFGGLTLPFIPVMGRRLGATPLQVSLLVAAPAIVLLLSLWIVNAVRSVHPVRLVIWPSLVGRAMFLLMPLAHTPVPYLLLVVLFHAVSSINTLGYAQVMRAVYPDNVRGRIMALVKVGMATSWVLASLLGGQLTQVVPFQWVFAVAGMLGMASGVVFSRIRPPERLEVPEPIDPAVAWRLVREDGAYRRFLLAFFIYGFGGWLISPAIPILLVDELHASNFQVGLLGAVMSAMWTISFYSWGAMIDRRSATNTLKVVFSIGALTPVIYLLAPSAWVVQLAGVTDGLTSAGIDLGWLAAALHYAPQGQVLHYVTLFNTSVGIRGAIAPFITGALIPLIGVRWIFAIGALIQFTGMLLMRRVPAPPETDADPRGSASTA